MRVFGAGARGEDHEGSDVDLLGDMPAGCSLLALVGLQLELQVPTPIPEPATALLR